MGYSIKVRNELRTNRIMTGFLLTPETMIEVELKIEGELGPNGIVVNMLAIQSLFDRMFGNCWNNATLVQKGNKGEVNYGRIEYVDFSPSLENIAKYIYDKMLPVILRKYKVILTKVTTKSAMGKASYKGER